VIIALATLSCLAVMVGAFAMTVAPLSTDVDYTVDFAAFVDRFLPLNERGRPWRLAEYQRRVIRVALTFDHSGQLLRRLFVWGERKKSGKTAVGGAFVIWWAWRSECEVDCLANDQEQSAGRVFGTAYAMSKANGFEKAGLVKLLATEIRFKNGSVIRAVASDYKGGSGGRQTLAVFDELWGYTEERAWRLWEEYQPIPTVEEGVVLVLTTAGFQGESRLLESLYQRGIAGTRLDEDLELYEDREMVMFWSHTPRQPWQTGEAGARYYEQQRRALRPSTYLRLHENRWVTGREAFITDDLWTANIDVSYRPLLNPAGSVTIGVDAGIKDDNLAVVTVGHAGGRIALVAHRIWKPSPGSPIDLEATVETYLRELHARMTVREIVCDPWQMARSIATLKAAGLPIREFPQTSANCTRMGQVLFDLLKARQLQLYPDDELRTQALSAVAVESPRGWRLAKEKASRKIDAIVALAMACVAAVDATPTICPHCADLHCEWPLPPMGLSDSPEVRAWFAKHPDPDVHASPQRPVEEPQEAELWRLLRRWFHLAEAGDPGADDVEQQVRQHVAGVEHTEPKAGARLRAILDSVEETGAHV
jgi:phage terminase large subunit-like protein